MQAHTAGAWLGGLARRTWLPALTTISCCALAARASAALVAVEPPPPPRPPAAPPQKTIVVRALPDGGQLVARNMFCAACEPGEPGAAPASATLRTAVLIATGLGRERYATVRLLGGAIEGGWGEGDPIPGLGRIERIAATWIEIVDPAGHRGRLSLRGAVEDGPGTQLPAPAPASEWADRVRKLDEQTYEVDRSLVRELVTAGARPGGLKMIPVFARGEIQGVRVLRTAGSVAQAIGLADGDVVSAIDGVALKNVNQLLELYAGLDQLAQVELTGTRRGQPLVHTLRLR